MLHCIRHIRLVRAVLISALLLVSLPAATAGRAKTPPPPPPTATSLNPLEEHAGAQREVMRRLQREHYRTIAYNDTLSAKLLNRYLDDLDPSRSFFLQSDIDEFAWYGTTLHESLQHANLLPAFRIFNRFQQRRVHRLHAVIERLEAGIEEMDFTQEDFFETDRTDTAWAKDPAELDRHWEQRLKLNTLNLLLADRTLEQCRELLLKRYHNQLRHVLQMNSEDVFQIYMNSLTRCYDPHTQYFSPRTSENFTISMRLSLEGIGAVLSSEDEYVRIVRLVPGGPADKSKLLNPADRIVGVAQDTDEDMQDVVGWRLDDVVELIRGPKGTTVRLEILPTSAEDSRSTRIISIERGTVQLEDQAARKKIVPVERDSRTYTIGVIELPTFYIDFQALRDGDPGYKSTARDIEQLLEQCAEKNIDGLILDLRNNGGGSLQEAVELSGKFLRSGPIVQVRGARSRIEILRDTGYRTSYDGPLVVLVNRLSASASEIVAAAIQDYGRGIVVGSQTFGKGTVQSLIPLAHGQLKATLAAFYRVNGESTQYRGVLPDITYPCLFDPNEIGESALLDALPWDTIDAVPFSPYSDLGAVRSRLTALHEQRMEQDPDYRYLQKFTQHLQTVSARTRISLCLPERERERTEIEQFRLKLENERRAALKLPLFETYSAFEQEHSAENETETRDPMLDEATSILIDYITLTAPEGRSAGRALDPVCHAHAARHSGSFPALPGNSQHGYGHCPLYN